MATANPFSAFTGTKLRDSSARMGFAVVVLMALGSASSLAASATGNVMKHEGWLDLNKNGKKDIYEDPTQPVETRVADLLAQMTLGEKIGQLAQCHVYEKPEETYRDKLKKGLVGSFLPGGKIAGDPVVRNKLQKIAVEESRLGIPFLMGFDSIHGYKTIFPIPLAQACAWEPELIERTQTVSALETSAAGIDWTFAPMVDLARDPRWGRIAEGFGEDPYLGSLYSAAAVRGFQGVDGSDPKHVIACLKHYVGYGAAEGGRDYNTTDVSEYNLQNFYLPQFHAGVKAGARTLMSAFNCLNGVPTSGNHHTLTEILRDDWKFTGFVISDWASVLELKIQGVAEDDAECARIAINAGVDMEMVTTCYADTLAQQVSGGTVKLEVIDEAVRRILRVKFERGLFDNPYVEEGRYKLAFLRAESLRLAREAAVKSCVLLKNENETLPLTKHGLKIALIGPLGADKGELMGSWSAHGEPKNVMSLEQGIRLKLASTATLTVVKGCDLSTGRRTMTRTDGTIVADPKAAKDNTSDEEFALAVTAAANADVVIMAIGEPRGWSGENANRTQLGLTGRQEELFDAAVATGKPVIVVLVNGRPLSIPRVQEKAAAILEAWQPGLEGGNAVADLLFGDASPSGRLTTSFPRAVGQVPVHYNHLNTGRPQYRTYRDLTHLPLYPFGFGLTYTTFTYSAPTLSAPTMKLGGSIVASTTLTNTGKRGGEETVQLYIRDIAASRARPVRELRGFQKVHLEPGESKVVSFTISENELAFLDEHGKRLVEPGKFELWLSPDSASGEPVGFELK